MTTAYETAVDFLQSCLEYSPEEDLVLIDIADAAVNAEGYQESFGDELPEVLRDPRGFMICWNNAVRQEITRRFWPARPAEEAGDQRMTLIVQAEFLPGPLKIYRAKDGNLYYDYVGTWPLS